MVIPQPSIEAPKEMTDSQATQIEDHGQISTMSFAPKWSKGELGTFDGQGGKSWLEVSAEADPRASVCFYYRGLRESESVGKNFRIILDRPPHMLMPVEIKSLRDHSKITSHFSEDAEYSFAWVEYRVDGGKVPPSVGRKL